MKCINISHPDFKSLLSQSNRSSFDLELSVSKWQQDNNTESFPTLAQLEIKPGVAELFNSKRSFADYSDFGKTLSEQEIINLKKEGNKVTAKEFLESIIPVNDFEKKLKSFLLSIDLNKLNGFDFVINDKYQGNIIGLNERDLFEKPTVIFNSKSTTQPSRYKLHEFLHSLLDTVINEEQEFRTELISLFDYVKTLPEFKNEYGVIGWWEFYTEGMTNPNFQAKLKNVTLSGYKGGKKSNVYEEFVKIINNILEKLGFVNKDYSALDEIINATTKVIEKRYGYSVKPGVQELFEENPEFSSQIYEALGFTEIKSLNELKPLTKELLDYYKINPSLDIDNIQNVNNILTSISKNSPWKHFRNLASIYLNYTKEIPYRLEFKNLAKGNGIYLKQFRLLEIENKLLQVNNDLDRFNYEMVILHEMTHGLTLYGYNTNKEFKNKVDKLFDFAKLNTANKTLYGLTSPEEFLAEILVNPDFQKEMNNISYDRKNTVLTFFNSLIKELLNSMGIKFNENSVLSEAVDLSLSIIPLTREDLKSYKDIDFFSNQIINKQKQQAILLYSQYLDSLNKPNTNPILQGNQQEQVKKFAELQERLNNKEFLEGAKSAYESTPALQELGTQQEYNDYIARVSLGIIKNPSSGEYNYASQVKDIVYHISPNKFDTFDNKYIGSKKEKASPDNSMGIFFSKDKDYIKTQDSNNELGNIVYPTLVNLKNPYPNWLSNLRVFVKGNLLDESSRKEYEEYKRWMINNNYDGFLEESKRELVVVFNAKDTYILGGKQDIEGFKEFVKTTPKLSNISSLGKLQGDLMESEKGQIGVNKQQLLMLLGPTMYNKPLAQVAVKELLQNSFDAIKARMNITDNKQTGNIDITVNYDNRTISIKDDGIGMTPDIVKNAFLSIGGTNKEGLDVSERSGGFGLAKVQFLLGSEYVKVVTVRDGLKTSLEATAVQLYNDDFIINKEQTNEPNGSYVEVKIPESYTTPEGTKREIEFPGKYKNDNEKYKAFDILDKPLIGNVNVSFTHVKNKQEYKKVVPIGENTTEETLPPLFSKIDFAWGSADLYMSTDKKENPKHRILSSGIYQFNYSFRFKDWEDIPYDIVVNIKPSVSSTSEQYPFNNQREGFKNTVQEDIKSLNNYLKKYASGEAEKDAKAVFSNITGLPKVDPNKVLTPEEREKLYADVEKTIAENKQRRIEQGLESAEEAVRKIWKLVIDKEGVKDAETGKIEVSNEKNYGSSFKAEKEIEKVEAIETTNFNPALPQYHNNTNFNYLEIPGAAEFFSDFGSVVLEMVRFAGNELGYDYRKLKSEDEKFFAGVSIDKQYGGVHVRKIINAIFVNPLAFDVFSLEEAVGVALHVTIHEINHTTESGEGANFTTALGILYGKIYATGKYGLYEGLFRSVYKKHFETFKKLKNEYDKSSTRNLSESFSGNQIKKGSTGDVQGNVDDVSTRQSSTEGYTGNQENNTKDKTGDVILSKFLSSKQDIERFKEFVSGKSDVQYQLSSEEIAEADEKLNTKLLNFLSRYGVQSKEINNFKERFGVDALGATDVLNKIIYHSVEKKLDTIPEEAAHMIVMLMGQTHPLIKDLMDNIKDWSGYQKVYDEYMPIYNNEKQVKVEALGKLVTESLLQKWTGKTKEERNLLVKILNAVKEFLTNLTKPFILKEGSYFKDAADKIAVEVLKENEGFIGSSTSKIERLNYEQAISGNKLAREIIDTYTGKDFNFKLVGSLAVAGQGETIYRPSSAPVHDLDFIVDDVSKYEDIKSHMEKVNAVSIHNGWGNSQKKYVTYAYLIPKSGYTFTNIQRNDTGWISGYTILNPENKVVANIKHKSQTDVVITNDKGKPLSKDAVDELSQYHIPVDFFVHNDKIDETYVDKFSSVQDIYFGKLILSKLGMEERMFQREKDQEDYRTSNFIRRDVEKKEFLYFQQEAQSTEKPSENIDNKIKSFLASIGVNIKVVQDLTDNKGNKLSGIAVADMLNKIIQVVDGKADITTLPEEAAHFFVEMLGESNPLYKEMFDKITSYKIYSETVDQYRNNKAYKNADGTLNINKLKKEAIAKLIMTHIIKNEKNNENTDKIKAAESWWSKFWKWITNIFKQNTTNPFEVAAQKIMTADISDLNLNLTQDELFFQEEPTSFLNKVIADQSIITLDDSIDPKTGEKKHVYQENKKPIVDKNGNPKSVTNNVVDPWYKARFPLDTRSERKKVIDDFAAERGTDVHADLQNIVQRYFDKNGNPRATVLPKTDIKTNAEVYNKLEKYILSLIDEFKDRPGTRFLPEVKIYSRKRNLPGTIDLLIVEPNGTTHIYDWKSQQIEKDQNDLKWFKPEAYRIQLGEYKKILMEEYGIFKFGKIRAVPIRTIFKIVNVNGQLKPVALENVEIEYDINNIPKDKDYLLPVVMLDESTGDKKLDSLLAKLNAVYDKISQGTVTESEKPFKAEELNLLKKTIRDLHVRKDMSTFIQNGLFEINKYRNKINDGTFNVNDVKESILILNVYAEGTVFLEELLKNLKNQIKTESDPDVIQYLKNLQEDSAKMSLNAKALLVDIVGIKGDKNPTGVVAKIANEFAKEEGITTLLNPETELDWLGKMFRSLSTLQTAALQLFYKILRRAQGIRNVKITELNNKLQTLRKNLEDWGKTKGLKGEDIFNPILDIDSKGNWNGDFVKIYSQEYFKLRDEALKNEDINWIKLNTDFDKEQYEKDLKLLQQNLDERYPGNDEYVVKRKQSILNDWVLKHSDSGRLSYLNKKNYYIKPKEKWQSEKYKFIFKKDSSGKYINQPLVDTYNFFQELIKHSSEIGMLDKYSSRFIPGVYKNKITEIIGSSFKNIFDIQGAFNSLAVDADGGFGNIDPLTGVLKKQLPVYFKKDLGVQREDGTVDYSNKSKDLFSVFSIWGQQMYNYEAMDSIREKSEVLLMNEQNKSRLETNIFGTVKQDKSTIAENTKNAEILEDFINFYVYGQAKGAQIDKSVKVGGKSYSLKKATQAVIKLSTFKALALNPLSGTATFVGGTGNALFAASKKLLFTESDWVHGCKDFTSNNEITAAGLDFFDFGLDDRQKNDVRNLSANWKKRNLKWDHLMFMQRYGDIWATYPVAAAMLRTHMFDGKNIVSIRDYVKKQNDYDNFYNLSESERKRVQKKIDKEIEELQKTKSLKAVGKIENGQFVIPGLEKTSDAAINFKAKVQKTLKSIIGNSTRDDINLIRMGLLGQVLMQFRSWMPQLMTERFGEMSKNVDLDTWEYGKTRLFLKHIVDGRVLPLMKEMILGFGNNTIEKAKQRYKEFVLRLMESGKISSVEEFMTEAEFIDMYIGNLRSMHRELVLLTAFLYLIFAGLGSDDDDEDVSGFRKYAQKALEKYKNEFSFYYSPTEFTKMLKNPVPLVGFMEDCERFLTQGIGQVYNFSTGDEEGMESNKPAKYFFRVLPITKEGLNFYALYDDEFRKEWGIK